MIDGKTQLFGIIGNPVAHSLSPAMHNRAFHELGINSAYVPFPVSDVENALKGLKALGIRGVSVTIPHKETVIPYLDEVDPVAAEIGAVNTILVHHENGRVKLLGTNSDWQGANRALENVTTLCGKQVIILGAGGSARAIGFGLKAAGAAGITLCSRTEVRGRALAAALKCPWCAFAQLKTLTGDILINATSVGMNPDSNRTPAPNCDLSRFGVVMDIVYAPLQTILLRQAQAAGCKVVSGIEMLLHQGAVQFELWTGKPAPIELMRETLITAIGANNM
jgi:shikimate dehydrogenase